MEYYDEEAKSKEVFLKFIDHTDPYLSDKMRTYVDYFTNEYEYELEKLIKVLYYRYGPGNKTNNNSNNNSTTNKKGYQIPGKSINTVRCKNCNKNGHDTERCWLKNNNQNKNHNPPKNIPKVRSKTIRVNETNYDLDNVESISAQIKVIKVIDPTKSYRNKDIVSNLKNNIQNNNESNAQISNGQQNLYT